MFRKILAFFICSMGLMLPWKLRCLYIEALGWITQFLYLNYVAILKFIVKELEKSKLAKQKNE